MNFNDIEIVWSILKDKGYVKVEFINEVWFLFRKYGKFVFEIKIIVLIF